MDIWEIWHFDRNKVWYTKCLAKYKSKRTRIFVCLEFCNIHKLNRQNQCFETLFQKQSKGAKEIDVFPRTIDILLTFKIKINDKYAQQSISWKQWFKKLLLQYDKMKKRFYKMKSEMIKQMKYLIFSMYESIVSLKENSHF